MARRMFTDQVFAQVGVQTGDGRIITPDAPTFTGQPDPLRFAGEDWGMHQGAVTVGAIETWRVEAPDVLASGWVDDALPGGAQVAQMVDDGVPLGVSVDIDDVVVEIVDTWFDEHGEPLDNNRMTAARRGFARFPTYSFRLGDSPLRAQLRPNAVTAAAGDPDVDDGDIWWVFAADEILERLVQGRFRGATILDMPAFDRARMGLDAAGTGEDAGSDTADADPVAIAAATVPPRPAVGFAAGARPVPPPLVDEIARTVTASASLAAPPRDWFELPEPDRLTPLHVGDDGQVYGHVWTGDCHTASQPGQCLRAPTSSPGMPWFHTGYVVCANGDRVATGVLTIGRGHADEMLGIVPAREHYDDTTTAWADVRVIQGAHGGWACGATRPGLTPTDLRTIRGAVPSGDWRGSGGRPELIAVHMVNHPGYPVARFDRRGRPLAIVAAAVLDPDRMTLAPAPAEIDRLREAFDALRSELSAPARRELRKAGTARARARLRSAR